MIRVRRIRVDELHIRDGEKQVLRDEGCDIAGRQGASLSSSSISPSTEQSVSDVLNYEESELMINDNVEGGDRMNDDDNSERGRVNENNDATGGGGLSPANLFGAVTCDRSSYPYRWL